ncbi:MAG: hypothetical protein NTZ84_00600 [Candidatus Nealsonbacteria bacterium]|nr:hypothetical protein [Candidatus Nealsonbacteria bacterium]
MAIYKKQKGISIVLIIIIASVVFTVALGINSISSQQAKTMGEIGYSLISFYAADSGAEKQLYDLYKLTTHTFQYNEILSPGVSFSVTVISVPDPSCNALNFCINSVGGYKEVQRAIHLEY